jgi:hypothetical protein
LLNSARATNAPVGIVPNYLRRRHKDGGDCDGDGDGDNGNEGNDKDDGTDQLKKGGREGDLRINN